MTKRLPVQTLSVEVRRYPTSCERIDVGPRRGLPASPRPEEIDGRHLGIPFPALRERGESGVEIQGKWALSEHGSLMAGGAPAPQGVSGSAECPALACCLHREDAFDTCVLERPPIRRTTAPGSRGLSARRSAIASIAFQRRVTRRSVFTVRRWSTS